MLRTKKTKKMIEIEKRSGKEIRDFLVDLYVSKNMTFWKIVEHLEKDYKIHITVSGIYRWFLKLDIPTREWRLPERTEKP
jgi:hypothetical protein